MRAGVKEGVKDGGKHRQGIMSGGRYAEIRKQHDDVVCGLCVTVTAAGDGDDEGWFNGCTGDLPRAVQSRSSACLGSVGVSIGTYFMLGMALVRFLSTRCPPPPDSPLSTPCSSSPPSPLQTADTDAPQRPTRVTLAATPGKSVPTMASAARHDPIAANRRFRSPSV